ncbi:uncharacterized protein RHO25_012332 [Cercospora beticola]|nr:hypothetical protein RHO25_012332 [Cercospora beticola]CAK1356525.1 unnamed protein product [Cercospora beticola]
MNMAQTQNADLFSSIGEQYEAAFGHDQGLLKFTQKVLEHLKPNSHILDVGCGTGKPVATTAAEAGHKITGIDLSEVMVELASKAVPTGTFEVADMLTYQPKDIKFDAVFNMLSLFLLRRQDVELMATRWNCWLPLGGILAIGTGAAEDVHPEKLEVQYDEDGACARKMPFEFMGKPITIDMFTRAGWEKLLVDAGFEVLYTTTDVFVPPPETGCQTEPHYFIMAKKIRERGDSE